MLIRDILIVNIEVCRCGFVWCSRV